MFDSKSPIVKIVSYAVTGFFVLIIVISFGMPDFMSRMGMDQSIIAIVNGEKVHRFDYLRYRNRRFGDMADRKMENVLLSYFIADLLMYQEAQKTGFYITDEGIKKYIMNIPGLRDNATGRIDAERLNYFFERVASENDMRRDLVRNKYSQFLKMGAAVPADEVKAEYAANNSRFQIKYSFLGSIDLQNMFRDQAPVTDAEVAAEMEKDKKEIRDPKTDRERIRARLSIMKLNRIKKGIIDRINALALNGGSFDEAQAILKGKVAASRIFRAGDKLADEKGQPITGIGNSRTFNEEFFEIKENKTSRIISAESGLYIFTPILRDIRKDPPSENEGRAIERTLEEQGLMGIEGGMRQKLYENAKKTINLKTDAKE